MAGSDGDLSKTSGFNNAEFSENNPSNLTSEQINAEYDSRWGQFFRLMFIFTENVLCKRPTAELAHSMFKKYIDGDFNSAIMEYNEYIRQELKHDVNYMNTSIVPLYHNALSNDYSVEAEWDAKKQQYPLPQLRRRMYGDWGTPFPDEKNFDPKLWSSISPSTPQHRRTPTSSRHFSPRQLMYAQYNKLVQRAARERIAEKVRTAIANKSALSGTVPPQSTQKSKQPGGAQKKRSSKKKRSAKKKRSSSRK